ncbi:hypothetical protein [Rickettsia hoogstraalii]|uniref:hypothetical protein n=1 Tax=Rickettsia hoogstraalii TaxID=467174 RepID=UPI000AC3C258|nr:hypothetical protein [Rickettsia hoogstraalii]
MQRLIGIAEVVKVSPDTIHDVFIGLKNLFIDSNENIRCAVADSIVEIVKAMPTQVSLKN